MKMRDTRALAVVIFELYLRDYKTYSMSILSNHKKDNKKGNKNTKALPGAKSTVKPAKSAGFSRKPPKTGGTRGS